MIPISSFPIEFFASNGLPYGNASSGREKKSTRSLLALPYEGRSEEKLFNLRE